MSSFELYYTYNSTDYLLFPFDSTNEWKNRTGTPVVAITVLGESDEGYVVLIPGRYWVYFDASLNAIITCPDDPGHPYENLVGVTVDITDNNHNKNIIPGLDIELASNVLEDYAFEVFIGGIWIPGEERYKNLLSFGTAIQSFDSSTLTLKIKNIYGSTLSDCYAYIINKATLNKDDVDEKIFSFYQSDTLNLVDQSDRTEHEITFDNFTGGTPNTVEMLIDGETHDIFEIVSDWESGHSYTADDKVKSDYEHYTCILTHTSDPTSEPGVGTYWSTYWQLTTGEADLKCDGVTAYVISSDSDFRGISFILDEYLTTADTANFLVSPGANVWQIKENTDTIWTRGSNGISLGSIVDDGTIEIDLKCSPGMDVSIDLNPIEGLLQIVSGNERISLGLSCTIVQVSDILFFRVGVVSTTVRDKFLEFGISAS